MKQDVVIENSASTLQSPTGTRIRSSKTRDTTPRSDPANGVSAGLKTRPRASTPEASRSIKSTRKPLNKLKPGEDTTTPPKLKDMEDPRLIARPRIQTVEQYAHLRRPVISDCRRSVEDSEETKKSSIESSELQKRLDANDNLVKNLQSEILVLKTQVHELQNMNLELESQNRRFQEDLGAAEAKISSLESHNKSLQSARNAEVSRVADEKNCTPPNNNNRDTVSDQNGGNRVRAIQKLIAMKMEPLRGLKEGMVNQKHDGALEPTTRIAAVQQNVAKNCAPPPPPPPPPRHAPARAAAMQKAPALVEFYHSLTKREGKKDPLGTGNGTNPVAINAHSSIVGEIQNRSAHLLAIKADIERKGDFIKFLIQKVQTAAYTDIEDVLTFVDWLDKELSSLADERAVLKHFDWPERKADAMREAAFEYRDLKRLENEVSSYEDDPSLPAEAALKKMASLLDKSERSIHRLTKLRELTMPCYRGCKIPTEWMLDSGIVSKIKLGSVKLAKKYMKRVSMELESDRHSDRESMQEVLLLQGVRFAYRAHQFAGGLDAETMRAFEEIRQRASAHGGASRELLVGVTS